MISMKTNSPSSPGPTVLQRLQRHYPDRLDLSASLASLPKKQYMVYILESDDGVIAVGHGQANRARVIFDAKETITRGHLKALFVRLHQLFAQPGTGFRRYLVGCASKPEALKLEKEVHALVGGNRRKLPAYIQDALFAGLTPHTIPWLLLKQAVASSYDGLADLEGWRKKGLIKPNDWKIISERLQLDRVIRNRNAT